MTKTSSAQNLAFQSAHAQLVEAESARRAGNFARAKSLCETLLAQHPTYVGALQTLGAVHLAKNDFRQALSCFISAAVLCPKDWVNLNNLAAAFLKMGGRQLAAQILERASNLKPDNLEAYCMLAEICREEREYSRAVDFFRAALDLAPSNAEAAHGLGDSYLQLGLYGEAADALSIAHKYDNRSVYILYSLTQLPPELCPMDLNAALSSVGKGASQSQDEFETVLSYVKAAILDRGEAYDEAWKNMVDANQRNVARHQDLHQRNAAKMASALENARRSAKPARVREGGEDCPVSLFILGPSRSGKTCLELLISKLEDVKRGHESRFAEIAARRTSQQAGFLALSNPQALPPMLDSAFKDIYVEELKDFAKGARIVTDTYPAMIPYVARVARSIPNCRFVWMKRDINDLSLRIFMRHYKQGNHYGYNIKTIFQHVSWYYELADLWLERFPEISIKMNYEDMVVDPRAAFERVAQLCGAEVPKGALPDIGDDRGCSLPYRAYIADALTG
jgi:tetratricopeptide (TPR) repeat protein